MALSSDDNLVLIHQKCARIAYCLGKYQVPFGAKLMDAGCGAGVATRVFEYLHHQTVGVDISATAIDEAQQKSQEEYVCCALCDYRAPDRFDVILCLDVLFHIVNPPGNG